MRTIDVEELLGALEQDRRDRGGICTTSFNVIAFVEKDQRLLTWLAESSDAFAEAHGFRMILLDGSSPVQNRAVRTHCKDCGDTITRSLEQIHLGVQHVPPAELRSIVHDLLHPNVHNVLLWGGEHLNEERFALLSELAETIVLFSSVRDSSLDALRELVRLEDPQILTRIRDLSYMRLLAWQDMTAQFFDDPELAAELPKLNGAEITSGSEAEAYYLAGWLASRLGWEPCGELDFCNAAGDPVRVQVRKDGLPRRIGGIVLHSPGYTFGISISPDADDLVCLTVDGSKPRSLRCVPLHDVDVVSLVERAIFSPSDGGVYLETLRVVRRLLEWSSAA